MEKSLHKEICLFLLLNAKKRKGEGVHGTEIERNDFLFICLFLNDPFYIVILNEKYYLFTLKTFQLKKNYLSKQNF